MISIRYIGCYISHSHNFIFDIPEGHNCWLLILTHTPAIFYVKNEYIEFPTNCAVLYRPNQQIYYRASEDKYINDWIRFDTDEAYITATTLPCGIPFVVGDLAYCHNLFQLLTTEHALNNCYKNITIDNLLRVLMHKLLESQRYHYVSPLQKKLNELKMDIYFNPNRNWSVAQMAKRLNISAGYLEDIYKNTFGTNCMDEVIKCRINLAKKYLLYEHYTIAEIASLCGYRSTEHFYRQFKKQTGFTPNFFRTHPRQALQTKIDTVCNCTISNSD